MEHLINCLNDKVLDLEMLLTEFDKALANQVEINTVYDGELGREYGTMNGIDEDGIDELKKVYNKLEDIVRKIKN